MNLLFIFVGTIAGAIFGVLSNWIYDMLRNRGHLSDRPSKKRVIVAIFVFVPVLFFVVLPSILEADKSPWEPIYIADSTGARSYTADKLLMTQTGCFDSDGFSTSVGGSPSYHVVLESWLGLTFVDPNETATGILSIEPVYNSEYEEQWKLQAWDVTMFGDTIFENPILPPIELPPNVPVARYFRLLLVLDVHPDIQVHSTYQSAEEELVPLKLTFMLLDESRLDHTVEFIQYAPEALVDGYFKFERECRELFAG